MITIRPLINSPTFSWREKGAPPVGPNPHTMPCLCLTHHQRRLESCDAAGWVRCQKCRGYISRERMEDGR